MQISQIIIDYFLHLSAENLTSQHRSPPLVHTYFHLIDTYYFRNDNNTRILARKDTEAAKSTARDAA